MARRVEARQPWRACLPRCRARVSGNCRPHRYLSPDGQARPRHGETVSLSVAHKRWSQGESDKVVIEELRATAPFRPENPTTEETQFLARLSVVGLPQTDLFALYQSWLDAILALEAAQITGAFRPPKAENSAALRDSLDARAQALRDLALLRARAENETQLSRRVDTNLAIKELEARIAELAKNL